MLQFLGVNRCINPSIIAMSLRLWPRVRTDLLSDTRPTAMQSVKYVLFIVIQLKARLQPNIGFTLLRVLALFTRSAITLPKVDRFG